MLDMYVSLAKSLNSISENFEKNKENIIYGFLKNITTWKICPTDIEVRGVVIKRSLHTSWRKKKKNK